MRPPSWVTKATSLLVHYGYRPPKGEEGRVGREGEGGRENESRMKERNANPLYLLNFFKNYYYILFIFLLFLFIIIVIYLLFY